MARYDGKNTRQKAAKLNIGELSGVDIPAHSEALVSLFKRKDFDRFQLFKQSKDSKENRKCQVYKQNKDDPDYNKSFLSTADGNDGDIHDGGNNMPNPNDNTADLTKAVTKLEAELATAQKFGQLNDIEKKHYHTLSDSNKEAFLEKSTVERSITIEKALENDPVIYTSEDGTEFRKSCDSEIVKQAKRNDALEKKLNSEVEKRETLELEKRASAELSHLPGDTEVRVAMLKAVDGIKDEDIRKKAHSMLKANNTSMSEAFGSYGHSTGSGGDPSIKKNSEDQLESLAKKHAADHNMSYAKAYSAVLATSEGQALYDQTVEH